MPELTYVNDDLKVEPAAPAGWTFAAGDTIIGTVVRRSPLITPNATLKLFFRGKLKVVIDDDRRWNPPPSTSPASMMGRCAVDKQIFLAKEGQLFEGPLHIQEGADPTTWPFQIKIPDAPDFATKSKTRLYPLHEALCRGPLPGTFVSAGRGRSSCWIEYYLDAQLHYLHGGEQQVCTSTHVIKIRPPLGPEFAGFGSQSTRLERTIRGYDLSPGAESADLSLNKKKRHFFGSHKMPWLTYGVDINVPKTIPLNNPASIPIEIRGRILSDTSSALKETPPKLWLTGIKLSIKFKTGVAVDGGEPDYPWGWQRYEGDFGLQKFLDDSSQPEKFQLELPVGEKSQPLDIGEIFQLSLHSRGLKAGDKYLNRTKEITADFDAHYIQHSNALVVEVLVTVGGQTERLWWEWPIKVL